MNPHPDYVDLEMPQDTSLGPFLMRVLTADDLDEDYAAVMSSSGVLQGLFGPHWPVGLTRAEDETDLHWHHREFTAKRSYAWVIRTREDGYIGCAYLFPQMGRTGAGEAAYWMIDTPDRIARLDAFGPLYLEWLASLLPDGYVLTPSRNG